MPIRRRCAYMEDALLVTNTGPISGEEAIELAALTEPGIGRNRCWP